MLHCHLAVRTVQQIQIPMIVVFPNSWIFICKDWLFPFQLSHWWPRTYGISKWKAHLHRRRRSRGRPRWPSRVSWPPPSRARGSCSSPPPCPRYTSSSGDWDVAVKQSGKAGQVFCFWKHSFRLHLKIKRGFGQGLGTKMAASEAVGPYIRIRMCHVNLEGLDYCISVSFCHFQPRSTDVVFEFQLLFPYA